MTSFVRSAEQKLNQDLRIDRMIKTEDGLIASCGAPLPDSWLEMDLVLLATPNIASGWRPLRYRPRDGYFRLSNTPYSGAQATQANTTYGTYTIEGRQIYFGGPPDAINGITFQISYYGEVPVFSDTQDSWVYTKYPSLYRYAALMHANLHAVGEEDKSAMLNGLVETTITKLNAAHRYSRASGSQLARSQVRSFG